MKTCYIFGAGEFFGLDEPIEADALILAADGGLRYVEALGLRPDGIVGDFDSLGYVPSGEGITRLPVEKDTTDLYEAVRLGEARGCTEFYLYGGTGGRTDHTLANLSLLGGMARRGLHGTLRGDRYAVTTAYPGRALVLNGKKGETVSVFSLSDRAEGVTLKGLYYPLENGTLTNLFPLGVSNRMIAETAEITVEHGILLIYYTF